jgi:hypothetical protein
MARRFGCHCGQCSGKPCPFCGKRGDQPHTRATLAAHAGWDRAWREDAGAPGLATGPCPGPARWVSLADLTATLAPLRAKRQRELTEENMRRIARQGTPAYGPLRLVR